MKPRLAIVSTFDAQCGIAGYTRYLVKQLKDDFEVEVFDLDQGFMRSSDAKVSRIADSMIKEFCARAQTFDFINVQFEYGTLGASPKDILRRFGWIVDAAPALSITFHTVLLRERFRHEEFFNNLRRFWLSDAWKIWTDHRAESGMITGVHKCLLKASQKKRVSVIAHTRRDARIMRHALGLPNLHDHPLVFLERAEAAELRAKTTAADFPMLENLPAGTKTIGVFGFISKYKGFDTVVRALRFLPDDYHLLIFGSVHPNEITRHREVDPYVRQLLDIAAVDASITDGVGANLHLSIPLPDGKAREAMAHPHNVARRMHFLGSQSDEDFARAMCLCDTVVMPYLEVGQSASGAISIALDMEARIIAARNGPFLQFARYYPNCIEMFDIGNHIELAERIRARPAFPPEGRVRAYGVETNRATYKAANSHRSAGAPSHVFSNRIDDHKADQPDHDRDQAR